MASVSWLFGSSGDWSTAGNWVTGTVPTSTDDASLDSVPSGAATISGAASAHSLTLNAAYLTDSGALTLGTTLSLTNNSALYLNGGSIVAPSGVSLNNSYIDNSGGSSSITGDVVSPGDSPVIVDYGSLAVSGALTDWYTVVNSGATLTVGGALTATYDVDDYGTLTVGGSLTALSVNDLGTLTVGGALTAKNSVNDYGTLTVGGALSGVVNLYSGASLEIGGGSASRVSFQDFAGSGTLKLDAPTAFTGVITGAGLGTTLDLAGVAVSAVSYDGSTLTVTETNSQQLTFNVTGNLTGDVATFSSDGHGGTNIKWAQQGETWKFGATGDWSTAGNWVTGTVPTSTDDASLDSVPSGAATISGAASAHSLTLNAAYLTDSGALTLGTTLSLTNNSALYLNGGSIVAPSGVSLNNSYIDNSGGSSSITGDVVSPGDSPVIVDYGSLAVSGALTDWYTVVNSGATLTVGGALTATYDVDDYGTLTVGGSLTALSVNDLGTLTVGGALTAKNSVNDYGTLTVGGALSGVVNLYSGASLEIGGGSASRVSFQDFAGSGDA